MTDDFPVPMGRDDQPTDERTDQTSGLPGHETDQARTTGGTGSEEEGRGSLPSVVDFDDHERTDVDDPAAPGIDDYTN
jgi:hypothetical protein